MNGKRERLEQFQAMERKQAERAEKHKRMLAPRRTIPAYSAASWPGPLSNGPKRSRTTLSGWPRCWRSWT
jgi:hypothetical protein